MTFQTLPDRSFTSPKDFWGAVSLIPRGWGAKVTWGNIAADVDYWDTVHSDAIDYGVGLKVKVSMVANNSHVLLVSGSSALDTWFTNITGQAWNWHVDPNAPNGQYVIKVQLELADATTGTVKTSPTYTFTCWKG